MQPGFNSNQLQDKLTELSRRNRAAFAAACCERLIGKYHELTGLKNWKGTAALEGIVQQIWGYVAGQRVSRDTFFGLLERCENLAPDQDSPAYNAYVIDACSAVYETLKCCLDARVERAVNAAKYTLDTLELISKTQANLTENGLTEHGGVAADRLIIEELQEQQRALGLLTVQPKLDLDLAAQLRARKKLND